jgi:hypothetical protein
VRQLLTQGYQHPKYGRASNAVQIRVRATGSPVAKEFDILDFSAVPSLSKPKLLELAHGAWIEQRTNTCFHRQLGDRQRPPCECPGTPVAELVSLLVQLTRARSLPHR